jgi:hypothetical protein
MKSQLSKTRMMILVAAAALLLAVGAGIWISVSATPDGLLASFSENEVRVVINLERRPDGSAFLKATFTPLEQGFHLYSKDLPRHGVDGVGRPTLLELVSDSQLQPAGALLESVPASPDQTASGVLPLPVYPPGPVTLTLPVTLPLAEANGGWREDRVSVTYMVCSPQGICRRPVMDKIITVKISTRAVDAPPKGP